MRIQRREEREKRTKLDPARDQSPVATINRNTQPIFRVNSVLAGPAPSFPITVTLPVGIRGRKIRLLHRTKSAQIHRFATRKCLLPCRAQAQNRRHADFNISRRIAPFDWSPDRAQGLPAFRRPPI